MRTFINCARFQLKIKQKSVWNNALKERLHCLSSGNCNQARVRFDSKNAWKSFLSRYFSAQRDWLFSLSPS